MAESPKKPALSDLNSHVATEAGNPAPPKPVRASSATLRQVGDFMNSSGDNDIRKTKTSPRGSPSTDDATAQTAAPQQRQVPHAATTPVQPRRPLGPRKAFTERPPIGTTTSFFASKNLSNRPTQLQRAATLSYEHDSDSDGSLFSSSEDEDMLHPVKSDGTDVQNNMRKRETFSKRATFQSPDSNAQYSRFSVGNDHFRTRGRVSEKDGRLRISVKEYANRGYLAKALGKGIRRHFWGDDDNGSKESHKSEAERDTRPIPRLNIVVMVIGSRGDIQPFIKIAKILTEQYGHRVRLATHPAFKKFIEDENGLDFFSVGGDPAELMAFMVKNPGLIPSVDTLKQGEVGKRRAAMFEMFQGMWRACINTTDDETDRENLKMMGDRHPFIADAIIANPPCFAHVHIAERLGVPLHMMFTFPYTPTTEFPHPLANVKATNVDRDYTNFMSYPLVEMMTWQGLGDLVNKFRVKTLGLDPVSTLWAPGQLYRLKVPHTYIWSPGLVPKPEDWGSEIDIAGFVFLEQASSYKPPDDLAKFLDDGPPPVYVGFGSIVVDDPDRFTKLVFDAVKLAGVRALVSKGWGGIGGKEQAPENVFLLENTPHDWLFPRVSAVVHHGGAGTTAIGLKCGKPTMIVPFFGDQPFWGAMVSRARAGAHDCIPYKKLTVEKLAKGIEQCLSDEAKKNVQAIADSIAKEGDGAENAVKSFYRQLPMRGEPNMRCSLLENYTAAWQVKKTGIKLCPMAADILVERNQLKWQDLCLLRHLEWNDFDGPGEPFTGGGSAIVGSIADAAKGVGMVPLKIARSVKGNKEHRKRKKRAMARQKHKDELAKRGVHIQTTQETNNENEAIDSSGPAKTAQTKRGGGRHDGLMRQETTLSMLNADPRASLAEDVGEDIARGFGKTGRAIAKAPMELSLALTQGFHNAPRLYGDSTVRRPIRIDGFRSGVDAGWHEFRCGWTDAFTGLYLHPTRGLYEPPNPVVGFLKGFGIGVGGFVLKGAAAQIGPVAYTLKGVHREIRKRRQPIQFIRRARILQGQKDLSVIGQRGSDPKRAAVENEVAEHWAAVRYEFDHEKEKEEKREKRRRWPHLRKNGKDKAQKEARRDKEEEKKAKKDEEEINDVQQEAKEGDGEQQRSPAEEGKKENRKVSPKDSARVSGEHSGTVSVDSMLLRSATSKSADVVRASTERKRAGVEDKWRMPARTVTDAYDFAGQQTAAKV